MTALKAEKVNGFPLFFVRRWEQKRRAATSWVIRQKCFADALCFDK